MTTYNTYQEAKIANPDSEISVSISKVFAASDYVSNILLSGCVQGWNKCNPADHCMTVEKFLADGHKFIEGDIYLNSDGRTLGVVNIPDYNNERSTIDCDLYVLHAAALEKIPTETPEEKEVLDGIESAGEVEWKNGDECVYRHQPDVTYMFVGIHPVNKKSAICWNEKEGIAQIHIDFISKPETTQQRKDRERACAIYDMCSEADTFTEESNFWAGKFYDLGYKKGKTHGTN
ncbi:hypothetical protein NVP1186O_70 [Vibrio phage 1.186.O._10N.286.49.E3]|nr:hypothetical protein NVP1186O_70 [Vibrio phage 1.186.O._10N.286.49.E3]